MKVKVFQRTQKVGIHLANGGSGIDFFDTDLGHTFEKNACNEFGVKFREGPHKPEIAYNVRIHSVFIYTDPIN